MNSYYNFNKKNLLKYKENYMYTPYDGERFIFSFFNDRKKSIDSIYSNISLDTKIFFDKKKLDFKNIFKKNRDRLEFRNLIIKNKIISSNSKIDYILNKLSKKSFSVDVLIDYLIFNILNNKKLNFSYSTAEQLLRRFEVNKRIASQYSFLDHHLVKKSKYTKSVKIYTNLSLLFLIICIKKNDIRYLNAALKLNDILTSVVPIMSLKSYDAAYISLIIEKNLINLITKEKK